MPGDIKIIDWDAAFEQCGGDRDFLLEILGDLLKEAEAATNEIADGIENGNFGDVRKSAHRIKGSASYLHADALQNISLQLQEAGYAGENGAPNPTKLWETIRVMFNDFKTILSDFRNEVEQYGRK